MFFARGWGMLSTPENCYPGRFACLVCFPLQTRVVHKSTLRLRFTPKLILKTKDKMCIVQVGF